MQSAGDGNRNEERSERGQRRSTMARLSLRASSAAPLSSSSSASVRPDPVFGLRVDYTKLLRHFSESAILVRAYFYTGEWEDSAISRYVRLSNTPDPQTKQLLKPIPI